MTRIYIGDITNIPGDLADIDYDAYNLYYIQYHGTIIANGYILFKDATDSVVRKLREYLLLKGKNYFFISKKEK